MTAATLEPAAVSADGGDRLAALEQVIEDGQRTALRTFVEMGHAIAEVRDRRLYLVRHSSFQAWLRERWDFSAQTAYTLVYTAQVADTITAGGLSVPPGVKSNAMRELVALHHQDGAEAVCRAWREIQKRHEGRQRPPSAGDVRAVLVDLGLRATKPRAPRPARLALIGEALRSVAERIAAVQRALEGRPLPPASRSKLPEYAALARRIADALDALADPAAAARELERIEHDEKRYGRWCSGHGRVKDAQGNCRLCGLPDRPHGAAATVVV